MNPLFPSLPLLEDLVERLRADHPPLENVAIVGVQHLLETTGSLFEAMFRLGLKPANVFLTGKIYSANADVIERLRLQGVNVLTPRPPTSPGNYENALEADIRQLWEQFAQSPDLPRLRAIVILDDGGRAIAALPESIREGRVPIRAVEQTVAGLSRIASLPPMHAVPTVEVASACLKRALEPALIAEALHRRVKARLSRHPEGTRFGIIGLGTIGQAIYQALREQGHRPSAFDRDPAVASFGCTSLPDLLERCEVIFGCSGTDSLLEARILHPLSDSFLRGGKTLINCTSDDLEFRSVLRRIPVSAARLAEHPTADLSLALPGGTLTIVRGGFPAHFDGGRESVPAREIQLTRALLLGGVVQACTQGLDDATAIGYRLSPRLQEYVARRWLELLPQSSARYAPSLLTSLRNPAWIDAESGGAAAPVSLITGKFRGRRGPSTAQPQPSEWRRAIAPILAGIALLMGTAGPARAESEFEAYLRSRNQLVSERFEGLVEDFEQYTGRTRTGTQIPMGRSPESAESSFRNVRTVATFRRPRLESEQMFIEEQARGALTFIARVLGSAETQVISWDPDLRPPRFKFQVLRRSPATGRAELRAPFGSECRVCHQGDLPLFSRAPWSESSSESAALSVREGIEGAHPGAKLLQGIPAISGNGARMLDSAVQSGAMRAQAAAACSTACGPSLECRRTLVLAAMIHRHPSDILFRSSSQKTQGSHFGPPQTGTAWEEVLASLEGRSRFESIVQARWPAHGFSFPNPLLPDPTAFESQSFRTTPARRLRFPATPRLLVGAIAPEQAPAYLASVAFDCLGFRPGELDFLIPMSSPQIATLLKDASWSPLIAAWPPRPTELIRHAKRLLGLD